MRVPDYINVQSLEAYRGNTWTPAVAGHRVRVRCERESVPATNPFVQAAWDWPAANDNSIGTICHSSNIYVFVPWM